MVDSLSETPTPKLFWRSTLNLLVVVVERDGRWSTDGGRKEVPRIVETRVRPRPSSRNESTPTRRTTDTPDGDSCRDVRRHQLRSRQSPSFCEVTSPHHELQEGRRVTTHTLYHRGLLSCKGLNLEKGRVVYLGFSSVPSAELVLPVSRGTFFYTYIIVNPTNVY